MKKNIKIAVIATLLIVIAAAIAYATTMTTGEETEKLQVSTVSIEKSTSLLNLLGSDTENLKTKVVYDELKNKDIYRIENSKYFIDMDTNNKLVGIHALKLSTNLQESSFSQEEATDYIMAKYNELNLPSDYEFNYITKFDDLIWQANFEKNYGSFYNKYESVKVFFIPDSDEIVALGVFYDAPKSTGVQISQDEAIQTASTKNNSEVVKAELSVEKADDNNIYPSWVITYSDNEIIYVDAQSNEIIGGDTINE